MEKRRRRRRRRRPKKKDLTHTPNTIRACHFLKRQGQYILNPNACYCWHIPRALRSKNIKPGDLVMVRVHEHKEVVMVVEVFREEIEETNRVYKPVLFKINEKDRSNSP